MIEYARHLETEAGRPAREPVVATGDSSRDLSQLRTLKPFVGVVLGLWLALVLVLGAGGAFVSPLGTPPLPVAIGVAAPVIVFLVAFRASAAFRSLVLAADLIFATVIQAWRFVGFGFFFLYAHGLLPGVFVWPAGLGDVAIALTAPWVARTLVRRPGFAVSPLFVIWNLLGILDLVAAVGLGAISQSLATGAPGEVTLAPMALLPMVLLPAFLVPLFIMLHLTALFQTRARACRAGAGLV